jgi:hypothetical protein
MFSRVLEQRKRIWWWPPDLEPLLWCRYARNPGNVLLLKMIRACLQSRMSFFTLFIRGGAATVFIAMLSDCGVGCLYHEQGRIVVTAGHTDVSAERLVQAVDNALRPMGFSGNSAKSLTPRPDWYWDYEFRSATVGKFAQLNAVEVLIKYEDLSITLTDWDRASRASDFDRGVTAAIETAIRSDLGAEITFRQLKSPAFCLGP